MRWNALGFIVDVRDSGSGWIWPPVRMVIVAFESSWPANVEHKSWMLIDNSPPLDHQPFHSQYDRRLSLISAVTRRHTRCVQMKNDEAIVWVMTRQVWDICLNLPQNWYGNRITELKSYFLRFPWPHRVYLAYLSKRRNKSFWNVILDHDIQQTQNA